MRPGGGHGTELGPSSDPAVAGLSMDDPPVLKAVAAGHVTITAGTASADVTIWAGEMPEGTVLWMNSGTGSGAGRTAPGALSAGGAAGVSWSPRGRRPRPIRAKPAGGHDGCGGRIRPMSGTARCKP